MPTRNWLPAPRPVTDRPSRCWCAGAEQMAGKAKQGKRMNRAVRVIGALDNYGKFFDDPSFQPVAH